MGQIALAALPGIELHFWKSGFNHSHSPLCPVLLRLFVHPILKYDLHQAMQGERIIGNLSAHQRVGTQDPNRFVKRQLVESDRFEPWTQRGCSLDEYLLWNGIRMQEGTHPQQISRHRAALFDLLKGERPGGGYGGRMVSDQPTSPREQGGSLIAIESQISLH